jgi:hypothetical protein
MVLMVHRRPAPPLSDFVDLLWYWDGYAPAHRAERLPPILPILTSGDGAPAP